jgi:NTP pyrophosphatase (non-canonical NTP hydrolase)
MPEDNTQFDLEVPQCTMLDAYQEWTETTEADSLRKLPRILRLNYFALGLGESGEVQDTFKKVLRDDEGVITPTKLDDLIKELGDTLWYVARMASELGVDLSEVATCNIQKLESRKARNTIGGSGDNR